MYSTDNSVLINRYRKLPAIECVQRKANKVIINEKEVKKTNKNGMGNQVGQITNRVTSMIEVLSRFEKDSDEYNDLLYRIECGQLHQQDELDKIKGIIAKPMAKYWYNLGACKDNRYLQSICAYRKPYFMIYIYDEIKRKYKNYIKESETKCAALYNCSVQDLYERKNILTDEKKDFLFWYEYKMPVGMGACAMNKICWYVESQLDGYKSQLHHDSTFDYNNLKVKRRCTEEHRQVLHDLEQEYCECIKEYKAKRSSDKEQANNNRKYLCEKFRQAAIELCPNDEERMNIILDITYGYKGNRQFCWDCIGDLLIERLEEMENENVYIE